jgi:opacity protein-like surface antigen
MGFTNYSRLTWNDNNDGVIDYDGIRKGSSFGIDLGLGANYFVTDNIALEANFNLFGFNYTSTKNTNTDDNGDGNIDKNSNFQLIFDSNNIFNTGNIMVGIKVFF